jgi:hypothetical protein
MRSITSDSSAPNWPREARAPSCRFNHIVSLATLYQNPAISEIAGIARIAEIENPKTPTADLRGLSRIAD